MSLESVKYHANAVTDVMRRQWGDERVRDLESHVADLDVPDRAEAALNHLIGSCHVRALGDIYIESLRWQDWLKRLDKLARACKRELERRGLESWESRRYREEGRALENRKRAPGSESPPCPEA